MPSCEKFKESLTEFNVNPETIARINEGYEDLTSKYPKPKRAAYFKRAIDIMNEAMDREDMIKLMDFNGCCKSGNREKASKAFAKKYAGLSLKDKLDKVFEVPYMGKPILNEDGTITLLAVEYYNGEKYCCGCSNYNKVKRDYPVSRSYCFCCSGHFRYHYEIMLEVKLKLKEITSSPLDTDGKEPCAMVFQIL